MVTHALICMALPNFGTGFAPLDGSPRYVKSPFTPMVYHTLAFANARAAEGRSPSISAKYFSFQTVGSRYIGNCRNLHLHDTTLQKAPGTVALRDNHPYWYTGDKMIAHHNGTISGELRSYDHPSQEGLVAMMGFAHQTPLLR